MCHPPASPRGHPCPVESSHLWGLRGVMSTGGPGGPRLAGKMSTHICTLPCAVGWMCCRLSPCELPVTHPQHPTLCPLR